MTHNQNPPLSQLRKHLVAAHSVEEFDPQATEASLTAFHQWDHDTGELGPAHDDDDFSARKRPSSKRQIKWEQD